MHRFLRSHLALAALAATLFVSAVSAQPRPDRVIRAWYEAQQERVDEAPPLRVIERSSLVRESPNGAVDLRFESELVGQPGGADWDRTILEATVNNRNLDDERRDMLSRRFERELSERGGLPFLGVVRSPANLARVFRRLQPASGTVETTLDGRAAWRIELVPNRPDRPLDRPFRRGPFGPGGGPGAGPGANDPARVIERVTLWYTPTDRPHLLQVRLMLRPPRAAGPTLVTATYDAFDGLDVPMRVEAEGLMSQRRRNRSFSVYFESVVTYEGYRYLPGDDR